MRFSSLYDITKYFKIDSASHADVLEQLKRERNKIHPDKNGGDFHSPDNEKKFHDLNEAIEWIESNSNNQQITINQVTDIIKAITAVERHSNIKNEIENKQALLVKSLQTTKALVLKKIQFPKIATTVIASIISFIWLFPQQIAEHPVIGNLVNTKNKYFVIYWIIALGTAIYLWLYAYVKDFKQQSLSRMIESDTYQSNIFKTFLANLATTNNDKLHEKGYLIFSKEKFINFIFSTLKEKRKKNTLKDIALLVYTTGLYSLYLVQPTIDIETLEKLADLVIKKNIEKGTITKFEGQSLEELFKTNIDIDELDGLKNYSFSSDAKRFI